MTANQILQQHGFSGERLMGLARKIANDAQRKAPAGLGGKYEDLVGFLLLQALQAAKNYDPAKVKPGYRFSSYLYDVMEQRVTDFYRRKSEGFGDTRSGSNDRLILVGEKIDDEPDHDWDTLFDQTTDPDERHHLHWAYAASRVSIPIHKWDHVNERLMMRWIRAAEATDMRLDDWIRRTLDIAAAHQLDPDKQAA